MRKGYFEHNYPHVINYLDSENIEYVEYNGGQQLRILGATRLVDLWPSRMKYHIIASEVPTSTTYSSLGSWFFDDDDSKKELHDLLNGSEHI